MVNLFQISRANESQKKKKKKSHFGVKFWPVQAASQTDAVSILLNIRWPDPSVWPWHQVTWPDFGWALCVRLTPQVVVALGPGSLLCCKCCPFGPKIYFYFYAVFLSIKALGKKNLRAVLQPTRVMFLWPEAEGVCCIPQGMHGALQEDGTALGGGWSVVIHILPDGSSWEEGRPETGSKPEIQHVDRQGSGYGAHPPPLLAYTHAKELSRFLCGFYYHLHPPGVKHWAQNSPCKPLKPSVLLENFWLTKSCSGCSTTSADSPWKGGKHWEVSAVFQLLSAWN